MRPSVPLVQKSGVPQYSKSEQDLPKSEDDKDDSENNNEDDIIEGQMMTNWFAKEVDDWDVNDMNYLIGLANKGATNVCKAIGQR